MRHPLVPLKPEQSLVRPGQLSALLGIDDSTLYRWSISDQRLGRCIFRRGYYSVQKLRDAGILTQAAPAPAATSQEGIANVG